MIFLGPVYTYFQQRLEGHINHWPLVRLMITSLDKTILYLLVFLLLRWVIKRWRRQPLRFGQELKVALFGGYLILLLMLTVFRRTYYPWQLQFYWERPLSDINWTPLVNTFKLRFGSPVDLWYQSLGNVVWFMPFGFGLPWVSQRRLGAASVIWRGVLISVMIESLQFVLYSGVADIDDVIFNTLGAVTGYGLYRLVHRR